MSKKRVFVVGTSLLEWNGKVRRGRARMKEQILIFQFRYWSISTMHSIFSLKKLTWWRSSFSYESAWAKDLLFLGKGQRVGIALYQFSWFFEERRKASNDIKLFNFLMRIFWLISIFVFCEIQLSMTSSHSFLSSASQNSSPFRTRIYPGWKNTLFAFSNHPRKICVFSKHEYSPLATTLLCYKEWSPTRFKNYPDLR